MPDFDHPIGRPGSPAPPYDPPPIPEDDGDRVFRETFLWRFERPEDRSAVLGFGEYLDRLLWEAGECGDDSPLLMLHFRAIAADLRHLAAYLQRMASTPGESSVEEPEEFALCCAAAQWSKRVADLAEDVRLGVATTYRQGDAG